MSDLYQPKPVNGIQTEQRDPMSKLLWTVTDLQQVIGCGRRQAYEMVNRKDIPTIRLGKRIYIPRDAFIRWLDSRTESVTG